MYGILFFLVGWLHVLLAPYTKVEESFNLHATHDLLFYGPLPDALPNYDHFVFPGAVPRSFIGSLALSGAAAVVRAGARALHLVHSKSDVQLIVRLTLATLNALGLLALQRAAARRFGARTAALFALLACTQFHVPFWMGRTLPNMLALLPAALAGARLVGRGRARGAVALLAGAAVVLRAELVLLAGPVALQAVVRRRAALRGVVVAGVLAGAGALALTVGVDSYFWGRWLWPELAGVYFNVYEGKSAEWGTSPAHTYFASHLPKLLLGALPLSLVGLAVDARVRALLAPCGAFVALLSCLGHKEWRFVVYVVPLWNVAGARGAAWLWGRGGWAGRVLRAGVVACLLGNAAVTVLLAQASRANYPGGAALARLNGELAAAGAGASSGAAVHIGNYAAQTGASLFLHEHAPRVVYNKTENLVAPRDFGGFDWVITEEVGAFGGEGWRVVHAVEGLRGVELRPLLGGVRVPQVVREAKLWIVRRE